MRIYLVSAADNGALLATHSTYPQHRSALNLASNQSSLGSFNEEIGIKCSKRVLFHEHIEAWPLDLAQDIDLEFHTAMSNNDPVKTLRILKTNSIYIDNMYKSMLFALAANTDNLPLMTYLYENNLLSEKIDSLKLMCMVFKKAFPNDPSILLKYSIEKKLLPLFSYYFERKHKKFVVNSVLLAACKRNAKDIVKLILQDIRFAEDTGILVINGLKISRQQLRCICECLKETDIFTGLDLSHCSIQTLSPIIDLIKSGYLMHSLNFSAIQISASRFKNLSRMFENENFLICLNLSSLVYVDDEFLSKLMNGRYWKIQDLNLSNVNFSTPMLEFAKALGKNNSITRLTMHECGLNGAAFYIIMNELYESKVQILEYLDFSSNKLSFDDDDNASLALLCEGRIKSLKDLDLSGNVLDVGMLVKCLMKNTTLTSLKISENDWAGPDESGEDPQHQKSIVRQLHFKDHLDQIASNHINPIKITYIKKCLK